MVYTPTHVPTKATRDTVKWLTGFGIEQIHIAAKLGITVKTLRKHYSSEVELGTAEVVGAVAGALFKKAMDPKGGMPAVTSAIFILKTRGRWKESSVIEHTGADGGPMPTSQSNVVVVLPDNNRDPQLAGPRERPMKIIEGRASQKLLARSKDDEE